MFKLWEHNIQILLFNCFQYIERNFYPVWYLKKHTDKSASFKVQTRLLDRQNKLSTDTTFRQTEQDKYSTRLLDRQNKFSTDTNFRQTEKVKYRHDF